MAAIVLERGEGGAFVAQAAARRLDDPDPMLAGEAVALVDGMCPDVARLRRALDRPALRPFLQCNLSRYDDPSLAGSLLGCLDDDNPGVARAALAAESDRHAAAGLDSSLRTIERRSHSRWRRRPPAPQRFEPRWCYQGRAPGAEFLRRRQARFDQLAGHCGLPPRSVQASHRDTSTGVPPVHKPPLVVPVRQYAAAPDDSFGAGTDKANRTYTELVHVGEDVGWDGEARTVVAIADGLVREVGCIESWGNIVIIEHRLAGIVGDDVHRQIERFSPVVQEPVRGADGSLLCCSVYAHLGPGIRHTPGAAIRAGEKIGAIGRPHTWENGGYRAHLHFAVHLGPYWQTPRPGSRIDMRFEGRRFEGIVRQADWRQIIATIEIGGRTREVVRGAHWLCGYVSPAHFAGGAHGWLNPRWLFS